MTPGINPIISVSLSDHKVARSSIEESLLRQDLISTLKFIANAGEVALTDVRGTMTGRNVRDLFDSFLEKPEDWPHTGTTDEWRYPRLMLIDAIIRSLNLVDEPRKNRLSITVAAKEFMALSPEDQFLNMFSAWWNIANWGVLSESQTVFPRGREDDYFELVRFLRASRKANVTEQDIQDQKEKDVQDQKEKDDEVSFHTPFTFDAINGKWRALCGEKVFAELAKTKRSRAQAERIFGYSVRRLLLDPLIWFGLLEEVPVPSPQGAAGSSIEQGAAGSSHEDREFRLTTLGGMLIEIMYSIRKQVQLQAQLAKYGKSLDSFYRNSMYGPIIPRLGDDDDDGEEDTEPEDFIPQNFAS